MNDFSCSNCAAPRDIGHVVCGYCRRPYDAATAASAIPCLQCKTLSAEGQPKCVGCGTSIVIGCVFCGALTPHTKSACVACGEVFLGAAERKAEQDADEDDEDEDSWEDGWAWCDKCQGLVYDEDPAGPCAAGGKHDTSDSEAYYLATSPDDCEGESGWLWCKACQGLFRGPDGSGACPATRKGHDGSDSDEYIVSRERDDDYDEDAGGWKHCKRCALMFWGEESGACGAGGKHDQSSKVDYSVAYDDE